MWQRQEIAVLAASGSGAAALESRGFQQVSRSDPAARLMATSGKGTATVGDNVQIAVDTEHII